MQVTREDAITLIKAAGGAATKGGKPLSNEALSEKLDDVFDELDEVDSSKLDVKCDVSAVLTALEEEVEIEVTGDVSTGKKKKTKKTKKPAAEKKVDKKATKTEVVEEDKPAAKKKTKKTKKPAAEKKPARKTDKYNSREGSIAFEINKKITKKAKDVATFYAELEEEGVGTTTQRIRDHLRRLHQDELIGKKDTKYHTV